MYQLTVTDEGKQHLVVLGLPESIVNRPAADVVFDVLGADPAKIAAEGIISEGQIEELQILQEMIFDRDNQGLFIRETVSFLANGRDLDPDSPLARAFTISERDGNKYMRCELVVVGAPQVTPQTNFGASQSFTPPQGKPAGGQPSQEETMQALGRVMFLHQIARGFNIDVTNIFPELSETIAWAEKNELIEIDVKKAAYKLTEKGKRMQDSYIEEAQDLIKRFDIYSNVDSDNNGVYFDTGLGRDLRVPAFEMEGVDPFRARFLLGINDGEWDMLSNWYELYMDPSWYRQIFAPVEQAPSLEEIGHEKMANIMTQGKAIVRQEFEQRRNLGR